MATNPGTSQPKIIIVAGPNGAGKTTFAREFLPREARISAFLNADLIAAGLSPFAPERAAIQAARLMLDAIVRHVEMGESFALETTLSGLGYARQIPASSSSWARSTSSNPRPKWCATRVPRVSQRVRQGGHDIPEATIRRRFASGRRLLEQVYQPLVDRWFVYDNAGDAPLLVDWSEMPSKNIPEVREPQRGYADTPVGAPPQHEAYLAALQRAARHARTVAEQTGTDLVIARHGLVIRISPKQLMSSRVEADT